MKVNLDTIILYVQDVERLKAFYVASFQLEVVEETPLQWVLLQAGHAKLGLHRIGEQYRKEAEGTFKFDSNCKIVFETDEDIHAVRNRLLSHNIAMREIKTFNNYGYWLCDGEDPEGNVFQLKQRKQD